MVSKIRFKNFKLFKDWQSIDIRPITILIGKNNSGKTAVLKLQAMLSESLNGNINEAVKFEFGGLKIGSEYRDLVYNRKILAGENLEFEISNSREDSVFSLLKVSVKLPADILKEKSELIKWEHYENDNLKNNSDDKNLFKGFLKNNEKIEGLNLNYDYIEALRIKPEEEYTFKNNEISKIGLRGENTYHILITSFNNGDNILENVSEWYKSNFENWSIEIVPHQIPGSSNYRYRFILKNRAIEDVNIINTGQGITQALPLITRSYMPDKEPVIIIIEEPESHLHPAAHGNLAQRIVDSYLEDDNKKYLIETHSQNFVLRLRRMVAEGTLKHGDLKIYYVDFDQDKNLSTIVDVKVNEDGSVDDWPEGIFGEAVIEARAIMNANQNDLRNVD